MISNIDCRKQNLSPTLLISNSHIAAGCLSHYSLFIVARTILCLQAIAQQLGIKEPDLRFNNLVGIKRINSILLSMVSNPNSPTVIDTLMLLAEDLHLAIVSIDDHGSLQRELSASIHLAIDSKPDLLDADKSISIKDAAQALLSFEYDIAQRDSLLHSLPVINDVCLTQYCCDSFGAVLDLYGLYNVKDVDGERDVGDLLCDKWVDICHNKNAMTIPAFIDTISSYSIRNKNRADA